VKLPKLSVILLTFFPIEYGCAILGYFFERNCNLQTTYYGDYNELYPGERAILVSNHISDADGLTLTNLALKRNAGGVLRFIIKKVIKYIFPAGPAMQQHGNIFVSRSIEDVGQIRESLRRFVQEKTPYWLAVFPGMWTINYIYRASVPGSLQLSVLCTAEGTYITNKRLAILEASKQFTRERNLPPLRNLMQPRVKGVAACINELRQRRYLDYIYNGKCPLRLLHFSFF